MALSKRLALFAAALLWLSGCGKLFGTPAPAQPALKPPAPLEASLAQAFFVGGTLHIKVKLEALASVPTDTVVVGVLGLREGQVVETQYLRLLDTLNQPTFIRGTTALVSFELSEQDLSEYQVRCSWGEEGEQLWAQHSSGGALGGDVRAMAPTPESGEAAAAALEPPIVKPAVPVHSVEALPAIEEVELEEQSKQCAKPPCDLEYTLRARVVNRTAEPIEAIRLAVGFSWSESKNRPTSPPTGPPLRSGEEPVVLRQLLQPGQGKKLKVKVGRAVPVVPGGAFLPYIRLVESTVATVK